MTVMFSDMEFLQVVETLQNFDNLFPSGKWLEHEETSADRIYSHNYKENITMKYLATRVPNLI